MKYFKLIGDILSRVRGSAKKGIALNNDGNQVLREAEARGYQVTRSRRWRTEAIVLGRDNEGSVHLWSNEDVVAYGKSKNWI